MKTKNIDKFISEARNLGYILATRNRSMLNKPEGEIYCKRIIIIPEEDNYQLIPAAYTSKNYYDEIVMEDLTNLLNQTKNDIDSILKYIENENN